MKRALRVEFAAWTDKGPVRSRNEDRWLAEPGRGVFAVIDGMGGHAGGELAADITLQALREAELPADGLMLANRRIWEAAQAEPALRSMGCVATAVQVTAEGLRVTHVGDTAAWLVHRGGADVLTARHTRAAAMQVSHVLGDEEAAALGGSNQLLRDIGGGLREDRDWLDRSDAVAVEAGDLLFLGSDGVHGPLSHQELLGRLRQAWRGHEPLDLLARALVELAIARGGRDNATAVVLRFLPAEAATVPVRTIDDSSGPVRLAVAPSGPVTARSPATSTTGAPRAPVGMVLAALGLGALLLLAWWGAGSDPVGVEPGPAPAEPSPGGAEPAAVEPAISDPSLGPEGGAASPAGSAVAQPAADPALSGPASPLGAAQPAADPATASPPSGVADDPAGGQR